MIFIFAMVLPVVLVVLGYWWIASKYQKPRTTELVLIIWSVLWSIALSPLPDYFIGRLGPDVHLYVALVLLLTTGVTLLTPALICLRPCFCKARITSDKFFRLALLTLWFVSVFGAFEFNRSTDWFLRGYVEWAETHVDIAAISAWQVETSGKFPTGAVLPEELPKYIRGLNCNVMGWYNGRAIELDWGGVGRRGGCGLWLDSTERLEIPHFDRSVHIAPGVWAWDHSNM